MQCFGSTRRRASCRKLAPMTTLLALSEAWKATLALLFIFGVLFPAIVTGLIVFAIAQAMAERAQNLQRRTRR
jgi:predicted anti-sigma-YlaC factor YlaD